MPYMDPARLIDDGSMMLVYVGENPDIDWGWLLQIILYTVWIISMIP